MQNLIAPLWEYFRFFQKNMNSPRFRKNIFNDALTYLSSRQVAGKSKKFKQISLKTSYNSLNKLKK